MTGRTLPSMTCPDCGASNPSDAEWCNLCARPFGSVATESVPPAPAAPESVLAGSASTVATPPPDPARATWTCPTCGTESPLAADACGTCGTTIFAAHGAGEETEVDRARATRLAWVPGVAHHALGDLATGAMVVADVGVALLFGLLLLGGGAVAAGVICLALALGTWGLAYVDVGRRLAGRAALLSAGRLLWVALAVVGVALVAASAVTGG